VSATSGELGSQLVRASAGHVLANGVDVAVSATFARSDGVRQLYFPAYDTAATNRGVADGLDGEGVRQLYGRLIFKGLDVTAAYGSRQRDVPTASFGSVFNEQFWRLETTDRHSLVDAQYGRSYLGTRLTFRGSYDQFTYDATYPAVVEPDGTPTVVANTTGLGTRWSAGSGLTRAFRGGQTLRAGVELIANVNQNQTAVYIGDPMPVLDTDRSSLQEAVYLQHEVKLTRAFIINAGLRYDRHEEFQRLTPRAALIFLPSPTQSFKYLYGSAFRAPNENELNAVYFGDQVNLLRPESIDTHELVWEQYVNGWVRTSASAYWYNADRLITTMIDDSALLGLSYTNQGQVRRRASSSKPRRVYGGTHAHW
jgi:hypothetical protein